MAEADDSSSSASYIRMVQHLIEECILFNLDMEECMAALSKHANIKPVVTSTVWKELQKENKEFFEAYGKSRSSGDEGQFAGGSSSSNRVDKETTRQKIQHFLARSSKFDH